MPKGYKAEKPQLNIINPETLQDEVNEVITDYCSKFNINIYDYKERSNIKHNEVNNILRYCYKSIFKPNNGLMNNQKSVIDYDDINQLEATVNSFLDVCMLFNKALGLWSFCIFSGIDDNTVIRWYSDEGKKLNPKRWELLKSIKEYNKGALISSLKDSPVGAMAVANNDRDTGLMWSANQAITAANNAVFLIPSERLNRLNISDSERLQLAASDQQEKPAPNQPSV